MAMNIELFASGCYLCKDTEKMIKKIMGPKCTLRVYDLAAKSSRKKAERYNIIAAPTIVGNGQKIFEGVPKYSELVKCSLEHGCKGHLLRSD